MKFSQAVKVALQTLNKYSPQILTGLSIATGGTALVLTVPSTVKAVRAIDKKKDELQRDLTKTEKFVEGWKFYIVPGIFAVASAGCAIGSCVESSKRIVVLASTLALKEGKIEELKDKIVEKLGSEKGIGVLSEATQAEADKRDDGKKIWEDGTPKDAVFGIVDKDGIAENYPAIKPLWYDNFSGRYFRATQQEIDNSINVINSVLSTGFEDQSLNDLYFELKLPPTTLGEQNGWKGGHDFIKAVKPVEYITHPVTGEAARVFAVNCGYIF